MKRLISEISLAIVGSFLLIDGFLMHGLVFNYGILNLEWLDPWINHGFIGLALIIITAIDVYLSRRKKK